MAFQCPRCGRVSHHPDDGSNGYCGACHEFTGEGRGRVLITAAGIFTEALVRAVQEAQIPLARLAAALEGSDGGALIAPPQLEAAPEPAQLGPGVPALPPEPDGAAYTWHPGDPVLLNRQVACIS